MQLAVGDRLAAAGHDALADGQRRDAARRGSPRRGRAAPASRPPPQRGLRARARIDVLPPCRPVSGVTFVSCRTNLSWLMSMSSSSAAIMQQAQFECPDPSRRGPVLIDAVLSAWIVIHESTCVQVGRAVARVRARRPPAPCRRAPRPPTLKPDDQRAAALDERPARELLVEHLGHGYFPPFAITAAAFWIAVRIRGYVPQRQRWPFIAVRICASVGRFVVASRSAAWIIIPFWQ